MALELITTPPQDDRYIDLCSPNSIMTEKPFPFHTKARGNAASTTLGEKGHPFDEESVVAEKAKRKSSSPTISSLRFQPAALDAAINETRDDASLGGQATSTNGRESEQATSTNGGEREQATSTNGGEKEVLLSPSEREVLLSHSDTLKYIFTQEEEGVERELMSHTDTLKYLLEDCNLIPTNFHDLGVKEFSLMPSVPELQDTLKHLLNNCGIDATNFLDVDVKESTYKPSLKELQIKSALIERDIKTIQGVAVGHKLSSSAANAIVEELRKKNELIKRDIDAMEKEHQIKSELIENDIKLIEGVAVGNNLSPSAVNVVVDKLRKKKESIKRDIDATEVAEAGNGSSFFKSALSFLPGLALCKKPPMAKEAGANNVNQQNKDRSSQEKKERGQGEEEDEVLMSHADTLRYLLKDCGVGI
jgi:hypothetical protein